MLFARKNREPAPVANPNCQEIEAHIGDYLEAFHQFFTTIRYQMYVTRPAADGSGTETVPFVFAEGTTVSEETKCYYSNGGLNEYHNISFRSGDGSRDFFINMNINAVYAFLRDLFRSYYLTAGTDRSILDNITTRISAEVENGDISSVEFEYSVYDMKWKIVSMIEYRLEDQRKRKRRRMTAAFILYSILFTVLFLGTAYAAFALSVPAAVALVLLLLLEVSAIVIFYCILRRERSRKP